MKTYEILPFGSPEALKAGYFHPCWRATSVLELRYCQGDPPAHRPRVRVRLGYDADQLYGIFVVEDNFVRAVATELHGQVWKDSCVEFFFTPYAEPDRGYFNLEINCCGTMLLRHQTAPGTNIRFVAPELCNQMTVIASVPGPVTEEIVTGLTWAVSFALPFDILRPYCPLERPRLNTLWRGNFYKCADGSSHPHWLTWSPVPTKLPDFHRPKCFGKLIFSEHD